MLLAMKDESGSNLKDEENDFMLENSYGEEKMEELTVAVMLMARIQPADGNTETVPSYDANVVSEVNASSKVHEQVSHVKCKTIIQTFDDDQIDSNIIFDDPYVENNGGTSEHDSNAHDEYHEIQMLACNVQREAENQKRLNNELKKQKELLQKELETSGLGYKNPERLKKAIAAQPKMYDGERLHSAKLTVDSPDSEETLEDAKESVAINGLRTRIDKTLLEDRQRRWMSDSQISLREFYKTDVIPMSASLSKNLKELKEELIEEV
ncbi:hypothetical protein Tco_0814703 [Tanacetum coccineum]